LAAALLVVAAQPAQAQTTSFGFTGAEQTFTVPAGVSSVHVVAIGARGGRGSDFGAQVGGAAGLGARLEADLDVTPGQILFIEVGGAGFDGAGRAGGGAGGFNGGGSSVNGSANLPGGGGGGATDVRTCARAAATCAGAGSSLASRLLVAAGGGGGGSLGQASSTFGGKGGDAGVDGEAGRRLCSSIRATPGGGGLAGTQIAGGAGGAEGIGEVTSAPGLPGGLGVGGDARIEFGVEPGGGGGGGFFGGGAGGGASECPGGGGGGGSSFATPAGANVSVTTALTEPSGVSITIPDPPAPGPGPGPGSGPRPGSGPGPAKPSNAFRLGKLSRNARKGTATLLVEVPGGGTVSLAGKGLVERERTASAAGGVRLPIKARGALARKLLSTGTSKLSASITFAPFGGDPATLSRTIKLIRAR
jgi:hypothetical protein